MTSRLARVFAILVPWSLRTMCRHRSRPAADPAGIALTQAGNLSRKFVQQSADRFGWDFPQPPRTEDELFDLQQLRHFAPDLGLARRSGGTLKLTAKGRRLLADPGSLWRAVAAGLLGDNDFAVFAGELFLALLLDAGSVPDIQIKATVGQAVTEEGFRETRTGEPLDECHISWAVHETSNLCRILGLLAVGGGWRDRSYGLTGTGPPRRGDRRRGDRVHSRGA